MSAFLARIEGGETLLSDGAIGTLLMERGLPPGGCPESFNLEQPAVLSEIARRYYEAGADIVQTNTFGGSSLKLSRYTLDGHVTEINRRAVAAVREVVGENGYVSGSCGPTGRTLKPYGETEPDAVRESFVEQIGALVDAGVDLICIETMTDLAEATLAIRAARSVSATVPVVATMTFDSTPRGYHTIMGTSIEEAIHGLAAAGANVIGSNCGNGIEQMTEIAGEFRRRSDLPLCIQSNAGLPVLDGEKVVYPETPGIMAEKSRRLLAVGISILGGCCGTTPEHISALRRIVDSTFA